MYSATAKASPEGALCRKRERPLPPLMDRRSSLRTRAAAAAAVDLSAGYRREEGRFAPLCLFRPFLCHEVRHYTISRVVAAVAVAVARACCPSDRAIEADLQTFALRLFPPSSPTRRRSEVQQTQGGKEPRGLKCLVRIGESFAS